MKKQTKRQTEFIEMVAGSLIEKFIEPLFILRKKNFCSLIDGLTLLLDWSEEFYDRYYEKLCDWEAFSNSIDNFCGADTLDDFIAGYGREKLRKYFEQNKNHEDYFNQKYPVREL